MSRHDPVDWTAVAPDWDRHRGDVEPMKAELTAQLLDGLGLLAGTGCSSWAAGTGELAARLADAVGPTGRSIASDVADRHGAADATRRLDGVADVEVGPDRRRRRSTCRARRWTSVVFRMGLMLVAEPERRARRDPPGAAAGWPVGGRGLGGRRRTTRG